MPAYPKDIYIEQGATFSWGFVLYEPVLDSDTGEVVTNPDGTPKLVAGPGETGGGPYDLANLDHARMQIRPKATDPTVLIHASSRLVTEDEDGGERIFIESDGTPGRVDIVLTDEDTNNMTIKKGFYDFELVYTLQPGELRATVQRILQGNVTCDLNTTRGEDETDLDQPGTG